MPHTVLPGPLVFPEQVPNPFLSKGVHAEHHVTVSQLATLWNMADDTVRRLFENEPGVLKLPGLPGRRRRKDGTIKRAFIRPYTKMWIPESVVRKVYARLTGKTS